MKSQHDNRITWRCRHCKKLTNKVEWSQGKWPLCPQCYERAYKPQGRLREA